MNYTENAEALASIKANYSKQVEESKYEKLLNNLGPADREVVSLLANLCDKVPGGVTKVSQLLYVLHQIKSKV